VTPRTIFICSNVDLGKVNEDAIVATVKISDIMDHLQSAPMIRRTLLLDKFAAFSSQAELLQRLYRAPCPMDYETGRAVGSFSIFMRIVTECREQFAAKIASSWHLRGFKMAKPNQIYEDYMNGVFSVGEESNIENENEANDTTSSTVRAEYLECEGRKTAIADQDLVDNQLQNELLFSLRCSTTALEAGTTSSGEQEETSDDVNQNTRETSSQDSIGQAEKTLSLAKLRDSSLFTFERPRIPGRATDWETTTNRDVSPTPTDKSVLNTFTTELLAKAEEASTVGSFGRGPSSSVRAESVMSLPFRGTPSGSVVRTATGQDHEGISLAGESTSEEDHPVVIDVSTDEETDDSVEELDFMILGSRKTTKQD
jgi:hypothetical protein